MALSKTSAKKTIVAKKTKGPKCFYRTMATARPSGSNTAEWHAALKANGIDPTTGRSWGYWKDGRMRGTWVRVDKNTGREITTTHAYPAAKPPVLRKALAMGVTR